VKQGAWLAGTGPQLDENRGQFGTPSRPAAVPKTATFPSSLTIDLCGGTFASIMTSWVYGSAFSSGDPASVLTPATDTENVGTTENTNTPGILTPWLTSRDGHSNPGQGLASFMCHVAYLDDSLLRGDKTALFDARRGRLVNRTRVGHGISFIVERADLLEADAAGDTQESREPTKRVVVVKTVREDQHHRNQWGEVLLEMRALLHEPIRYHPNIVRLLDIRWDVSADTGSPFPAIVQEYASFGTLDKLQQRSQPLPFSIKQKLCYDVGRALSIIHACGMVHGDLKHENVLIFPNSYLDPPNQPYTAKLADFGGTVMDMSGDATHRIPMHTFPYEAPEISEELTEEGAKKTDAYSYGMLVWRCMIDSQDILTAMGMTSSGSLANAKLREDITMLKLSDGLLETAIHNIANYFFLHRLPSQSFNLVTSALMFTLRGDPKQRALDRAQVRLRGMDSVMAYQYVSVKDDANKKTLQGLENRIPGRHGMDVDGTGYMLGRLGNDYDAQNNLPGFRPDLPRPTRGGFLFEPLRLRHLLDRSQQEAMVRDFEAYANAPAPAEADTTGDLRPEPWSAAYFLFQSYVSGFGVAFDADKACYWLRRAAEPPEEQAGTDYLALAWVNRIHAALGVPNPYDAEKQFDNLFWGAVRGHRHCIPDAEALISSASASQQQIWRRRLGESDQVFNALTGATGMPFFASRKLTKQWALQDLAALDSQLKQELGGDYDSCLRPASETSDPIPDDGYLFDKIFVNHKGHGLLHLAVVQGRLPAVKHLCQKYLCNINLKNQSHGDTPLTLACRTGRFDIAMWLLENGADPNGAEFCEESPLHCISAFSESEMEAVVDKLMTTGADIEKHSDASRKDIRGILADWEDNFSMTLTPLGRAVLKQSMSAVNILLKHGARPTERRTDRNRASQSPVELAAVLTLPDILEELLRHVDENEQVMDECDMLEAARSEKITPYDSLSLQSRLVRCGVSYKNNLARTLTILHDRRQRQRQQQGALATHPPGKHLYDEIMRGNTDIAETLLSLGHSPEGSPSHRPLVAAVKCNNAAMFHLLMSQDPPPFAHTADSHETLLHYLASRLTHSPTDLALAEYLVSHGIEDPDVPNQPSPLVIAIRNGFFSLADLLVSKGAGTSLNTLHAVDGATTDSHTLLGELIHRQTSTSLRAVKYLAHLHKTTPTAKISPLVSSRRVNELGEEEGVSAVHALASIPHAEWNSHGQISATMIQVILEMFPSPESLGDWAIHQTLGTAVQAAVVEGHSELTRALLTKGYRGDWNRTQNGKMTPLELARIKVMEEVQILNSKSEISEEEVTQLKRRVEIVELLEAMQVDGEGGGKGCGEGDGEGGDKRSESEEEWKRLGLGVQIPALLAKVKGDFIEPEINRDDATNMPADLSSLTDERPSGWTDGCEMTTEMSLRIFLKHFREDNSFGDSIAKEMSRRFNKRV